MSDTPPISNAGWINVKNKLYNLNMATTIEYNREDIIVTWPGEEIIDTKYDKIKKKFYEKKYPIQIRFSGENGLKVLNWAMQDAEKLEGDRTVFVTGHPSNRNKN